MRWFFVILFLFSSYSWAQEKTIRVVIGLSPSSTFPIIVKTITDNVSDKSLSFIPDFKVGQGNLIAYQHAAKSKPDGRTLVFTSTSVVTNPLLHKDAGYEYTDFEPVIFIGKVPSAILVNSRAPIHSVNQLISYAKKNPNKITYGHQGFATQSFLAVELLAFDSKINFINIPYKDSDTAVLDMLSGNIDMSMVILGRAQGYVNTGKVRLIATTGTKREIQFPNVPTVNETISGFESYVHYAIQVPRGVSSPVLENLRKELTIGLKNDSTQKILEKVGIQYQEMTPSSAELFFKNEFTRWSRIIKAKNIMID